MQRSNLLKAQSSHLTDDDVPTIEDELFCDSPDIFRIALDVIRLVDDWLFPVVHVVFSFSFSHSFLSNIDRL